MTEIVLPNPKYLTLAANRRQALHSQCLRTLAGQKDIVINDKGPMPIPPRHKHMIADNNGKYGGFFTINGKVFGVFDTDNPESNVSEWARYYQGKVTAIFLVNYFKKLKPIFEEIGLKVLPIFSGPNFGAPFVEQEVTPLPQDQRTVSVFFLGKFKNHVLRDSWSNLVMSQISDCCIRNSSQIWVSEKEYFDTIRKSKIVWSPPTCVERHADKSTMVIRDREAMCVESLCVRLPIDSCYPAEMIPGEHFVQYSRDGSDLVDTLKYYLENEEERHRIARNGREFFLRHLTVQARAKYLLDACLSV